MEKELCSDSCWNWIWKLQVPKKINFFIWLIFHNALPTDLLQLNHHLTSTSTCPRFLIAAEDELHYLRDYGMVRSIWISPGFSQDTQFLEGDYYSGSKFASTGKACLFLAGLWWLWKQQHNLIVFLRMVC